MTDLLVYLLPHYIREGKSYLTIGFGCTGGQHRSVMIAIELRKRLEKAGLPSQGTASGCAEIKKTGELTWIHVWPQAWAG